ncbi:MAG: methyltransferase domain-containing protein [Bacteroidales bacterium]|nr:methyltransferase domain-containing protein [Lachnoclostridium sp.]MCM1383457.1 methyltransferase domain-containing protein [Lachnoclostridium sp.]MCM1464306.1 methyltransferase domain-containing protein [Bacteroidales bacterium]
MQEREQIGKVTLDYGRYPGEDFYCDGDVEDELLGIARDFSAVEYAKVIEERRSWPVLYHLSGLRENIAEWIPMDKSAKVLEVGSGCGAVTGVLAKKAGSVTCVDLSKKRSLINAHRHSECENITIHVGNFKDIEPDLPKDFDYICLIGVFEYGVSYIGGETPFEDFLRILLPHLAKGGRIIIAIENKYGLKYFAGCKEDHLGTWFSGIENYAEGDGVRTFSKKGLQNIFNACGVKEAHFYYPYPDYKFMTALYSDDYLPRKGELSNNLRNFDRDRMLLFDEKNAFDGIVEDGLFDLFSNSFLVVIGKDFDIQYEKYSNDRAPEYAIRTEIRKNPEGELCVRKYPMSDDAAEHIKEMETAYQKLVERYRGGRLEINRCELIEDEKQTYIQFEFVEGTPLSELMDRCLEKDDQQGFLKLFEEYMERIGYNGESPVADYDLIFSNILVNGDKWTLIDYEWTFGKQIDARELAFRAIYCYILEDEKRNKLNLDLILDKLEVTEAEAEEFREQERGFQSFVSGRHMVLAQMRELIGNRVAVPQTWLEKYWESEKIKRIQIYEDRGEGYKEEESYLIQPRYEDGRTAELTLKVDGNVKMLRIDPAFNSCAVKILELTFNEEPVPLDKKHLLLNGRIARPSTIVFPTEDPNINIMLDSLSPKAENKLSVKMEVSLLPLGVAQEIADAVKRLTPFF